MKRYIILLLCFYGSFNLVLGQGFEGGLLGGIVGSQVAGDQFTGFDKFGITAGGYVRMKLSDKWALQMEMEYTQKGSRHNADPQHFDTTYQLSVNYIDVPILLQFTPPGKPANPDEEQPSFSLSRITFEAGLDLGVLLSHEEISNGVDLSTIPTQPGFTKTNLSIILGLYYPLTERWKVNFRASSSLVSFRTWSGTYPPVGYVYRISRNWKWGQFHDLLMLSVYYQL